MAKARDKITFDRTEIVAIDLHPKKPQIYNIPYDKLISIQFDKVQVHQLFKTVDAEKITLTTRVCPEPIYYLSTEEGQYFDEYKAGLEKFAKENRISFKNNL